MQGEKSYRDILTAVHSFWRISNHKQIQRQYRLGKLPRHPQRLVEAM
jgi:hypothetical protein